jgi:GT2 family glycosyltransferase
MEISVIIAYYQKLSNLELLLDAFDRQTFKDFEVIIAEDDNNPETTSFLKTRREAYSFPVTHLNQEAKKGFRKNKMLNKAVRASGGRTLVFIDGDCIPHRNFLKQYYRNSGEGTFLYGRRVLLGKRFSDRILAGRSLSSIRFLSILFSDSRLVKEGVYWSWFGIHFRSRQLSGCNWGIRRDDLLKVNGFDEDYVKPGVGEDFDVEWRLKSAGITMRSIRNRAIVYHLDHPKLYRENEARHNYEMLEKKKLENRVRCLNGLETIG